jgi:hypothetical protein
MESGMTLDLIKSQLMMEENTATAGFNTKGDQILIPFEEDDLGGSRVLVREG